MTLEQYLQTRYKASSIQDYGRKIKQFTAFIQEEKTTNLKQILHYFKYLRAKKLHPKTLRNHLQAIKIYYHYLQQTQQRKDNPIKNFYLKDKIDKEIKTETLYTKEELETFYQEQTLEIAKVIVSLLIHQALTVTELIALKIKEINLKKAEIQINKRTLPLYSHQILVLNNYILENKFTKEDNLLKFAKTNINKHINKNRKTNKLQALKIRQSVIANLLKTHDVRIVQVFSGHKRSTSTEQYKQSELEALQTAVNQYHPLK